jgi:hypothetical protein
MTCNHNHQGQYDQWTEPETRRLNMRTRAPGNNGPDSLPENTERTTHGWIGVDLDGTLAKSVKAETGEEIGVPIHLTALKSVLPHFRCTLETVAQRQPVEHTGVASINP